MTHTCLTPRNNTPYTCVNIRVTRPVDRWGIPTGGTWTAACTRCPWTVIDRGSAAAAADAGREHIQREH